MSHHPIATEPVMPQKSPARTGKHQRNILKPGLVLASISLFWAAAHEPTIFSAASILVWVLSSATVGVLVKALFVVVEPLFRLMISRVRKFLQTSNEQQGA